MKRLLGLLLVSATLSLAAPAQACACGGVVDQPGGDTSVSSERAVLVWDGTHGDDPAAAEHALGGGQRGAAGPHPDPGQRRAR